MRGLIRISYMAGDLVLFHAARRKRKRFRRMVAFLHDQLAVINGFSIKARAGSGFEP